MSAAVLEEKDLRKALEDVLDDLKERKLLEGLDVDSKSARENILDAATKELTKDGNLTADSLRDKKMLLKMSSVIVQAAVLQKYDPNPANVAKFSLAERFDALKPEQKIALQKDMDKLSQQWSKKFSPSPSPSAKPDQSAQVAIVDSAGNVIAFENRFARAGVAFDSVLSMMARNIDDSTVSKEVQKFLDENNIARHAPSNSLKMKYPGQV